MRRQTRGLWLVAGLGCLLVAQVAAITIRATQDIRYEPLTVDQELPFEVSGWPQDSDTNRKAESGNCHLAFICDPGCAACNALADRYVEETASNPNGARPLWLMGGDSAAVASWADEHGLPRDRVLALATKKGLFCRSPVAVDIGFTPTRVVLTPGLVVKDARPSDALLSHEELRNICRNGGIAPQGLGELKSLLQLDGKS